MNKTCRSRHMKRYEIDRAIYESREGDTLRQWTCGRMVESDVGEWVRWEDVKEVVSSSTLPRLYPPDASPMERELALLQAWNETLRELRRLEAKVGKGEA